MTPLREKMIDDLKIRNYSEDTVRSYVYAVFALARYFRRTPDLLNLEDVRAFLVFLVKQKKPSWSWYNVHVCGIRFFYRVTLQRDWVIEHIPYGRRPRRLPMIASRDQLIRFFDAVDDPQFRVLFMTIYASGLRSSEARALLISDIESDRMLINVRHGKGDKQRFAPLSPALLEDLRAYYRAYRPESFLFFGQDKDRPIAERTLREACVEARERAKLSPELTTHSLRHTFATNLLEAGVDLRTIQVILGHSSSETTEQYVHVRANLISATKSPFDLLNFAKPKSET
jgi:integrase/recombinase XerD